VILVFGATGHIGRELISILSSEGVPTIAVARAPERARPLPGIRWAKADLADPASIDGLLGGVETMFLLTGNGPDLGALQATAIRAAAKSGVEYVVKLSALGASPFEVAHRSRPLRGRTGVDRNVDAMGDPSPARVHAEPARSNSRDCSRRTDFRGVRRRQGPVRRHSRYRSRCRGHVDALRA
jgi:uncharacterized protein YbjT (DUF2867 family)